MGQRAEASDAVQHALHRWAVRVRLAALIRGGVAPVVWTKASSRGGELVLCPPGAWAWLLLSTAGLGEPGPEAASTGLGKTASLRERIVVPTDSEPLAP